MVNRSRAFLRGRELFERHRAEWLVSHHGELAIIKDGVLVGFEAQPRVFDDDTFAFKIESEAEEVGRLRSRVDADPWGLVCTPFLDTDMPQWVDEANRLLRLKGFGALRVGLMRVIAAGGCVWNALWWEWAFLGLADVLLGWSYNVGLLVVILGVVAILLRSFMSICAALLLTPITVWLFRAAKILYHQERSARSE